MSRAQFLLRAEHLWKDKEGFVLEYVMDLQLCEICSYVGFNAKRKLPKKGPNPAWNAQYTWLWGHRELAFNIQFSFLKHPSDMHQLENKNCFAQNPLLPGFLVQIGSVFLSWIHKWGRTHLPAACCSEAQSLRPWVFPHSVPVFISIKLCGDLKVGAVEIVVASRPLNGSYGTVFLNSTGQQWTPNSTILLWEKQQHPWPAR